MPLSDRPKPRRSRGRRWKLLAALISLLLHGGLGLWMLQSRHAAEPLPPDLAAIEVALARPQSPPPPSPPPLKAAASEPEGGGGGSAPSVDEPPNLKQRRKGESPLTSELPLRETPPAETLMALASSDPGLPDLATPTDAGAAGLESAGGAGSGSGEGPGIGPGSGPGEGAGPGSGAGRGGHGVGGAYSPPGWREKPAPFGSSPNFPALARAERVSGEAVIRCRVSIRGEARRCVVLSETPSRMRFGRAAVLDARTFKLRPAQINGRPVDGAEMTITLRYHVGPNPSGGLA